MPLSVLIIDDEPTIRDVIKHALSGRDYDIDMAENGQVGLDKLHKKQFDIAIVDVMMPVKNGLDFLRESKPIQPNLTTIMVSGLNDVDNIILAIKEGAYHFLLKPVDLELLDTLLNDIEYKKQLEDENRGLKSKLEIYEGHPEFIGTSSALSALLSKTYKVAKSETFCLITGEQGTGKDQLANLVHKNSNRKKQPFYRIDCSTYNESQLTSELFGYERGAFPGAYQSKAGLLELSDSSSLCISHIDAMPLTIQGKLIRTIESGFFQRLGGHKKINCNVRIISTSNTDLKSLVTKGAFREDLYFKLNVVALHIPPLRERIEDIPLLIKHFLKILSSKDEPYTITNEAINYLLSHPFDHNISELKHLIEQATIAANSKIIDLHDIIDEESFAKEEQYIKVPINQTISEIEKFVIKKVLEYNKGDKKKTAEMLDISVRKIFYKLKEVKESKQTLNSQE